LPLIGGSVLSIKNPLRDQIKDMNLREAAHGKFYTLTNIKKHKNEPIFMDI
jgi:hypothetical protein